LQKRALWLPGCAGWRQCWDWHLLHCKTLKKTIIMTCVFWNWIHHLCSKLITTKTFICLDIQTASEVCTAWWLTTDLMTHVCFSLLVYDHTDSIITTQGVCNIKLISH
jgi:hypothetical protein